MPRRLSLPILLAALFLLPHCSLPVSGGHSDVDNFQLVGSESRIWFVGIKNNAVAVPGVFADLAGMIDVTGHRGWIEVKVASLATGDPKRDESIVTHLFGAKDHPVARFAIKDTRGADALPPPGGSVELEVTGLLTVRGVESPLSVPARLTRQTLGRIRVQTLSPVVLTKEQLKLEKAFQALQAVCGHEALSGAVPILFDLVFEADR